MKFAVVLLALAATAAGAQEASPANSRLAPIPGEPSITIEAPAAKMLAASQAKTSSVRFAQIEAGRVESLRRRNAFPETKVIQVGLTRQLQQEGETKTSPALEFSAVEGGSVARLTVESPAALAMRVGLQVGDLPKGAELRVSGSDRTDVILTTAAGITAARSADGTFWTPVTEGSTQTIEIFVPEGTVLGADAVKVRSASHLFASPSTKFSQAKALSESCNIDAACSTPASTALANARKAVARMVFTKADGSYLCTGTLINDADLTTQVPYFYSANHCIASQAEASTLNTFWFYEYPTCTLGVASGVLTSVKQLSGGATLIYRDANRDALLLRLNNPAPAGAYFSGWDPNTMLTNATVTGIHHPHGDFKKVSNGVTLPFTEISDFENGITNQTYITVAWLKGTTEGGSSGSGLFTLTNNEYFLRGGLFGGDASCSSSGSTANSLNRDYYSRFDQVYPSIKSIIGNSRILTAVEYYNRPLNHYFVTAAQAEMDLIDRGDAGPGWERTGKSFQVYSGADTANAAIVPVCRFYGTPGKGPNSHFYTGSSAECAFVKTDPGWTYEGMAFATILPVDQVCPQGMIPVYRAYNDGAARNDSNHRYSTDLTVLAETNGYRYEAVAFCAPQPPSISPF